MIRKETAPCATITTAYAVTPVKGQQGHRGASRSPGISAMAPSNPTESSPPGTMIHLRVRICGRAGRMQVSPPVARRHGKRERCRAQCRPFRGHARGRGPPRARVPWPCWRRRRYARPAAPQARRAPDSSNPRSTCRGVSGCRAVPGLSLISKKKQRPVAAVIAAIAPNDQRQPMVASASASGVAARKVPIW